jgi:hypothetical protein
MDLGDAFYPGDPLDFSKSVPAGRYTASIVSMDISKNVKFGRYVADIFKPEYEIDKDEHPDYADSIVRDNGIFRYKKTEDSLYEHKKNWGFAKFISMMKLRKEEGEGNQLPFLYLHDIKMAKVLIDVYRKRFINDLDTEVYYPVATVIQLLEQPPVPF